MKIRCLERPCGHCITYHPREPGRTPLTEMATVPDDQSQRLQRNVPSLNRSRNFDHVAANLIINCSFNRRQRMKYRRKLPEHLKESLRPGVPLVLSRHGDLPPDHSGKRKLDLLVVILSGDGLSTNLGSQSFSWEVRSPGRQPNDHWGMLEKIKATDLDATAPNTYPKNGT